jgi:hypothetical protein
LTATVPIILASILNETIVAGMVVLLHRCRTARLVPAAHLYISYAQDISSSVYDRFTKGFCRCGNVCRCSFYVIALVGGIERTKLQIGARPDKRRNARAG